MDYDYIKILKEQNISLKLLRSDNAPLIISFLYKQFKEKSNQAIISDKLEEFLFDYLFHLREQYGDEIYPETARKYLDNWANEGFLRKYYLSNDDRALYELTPHAEKAFEWIKELDKKEFIGTESRLFRIFELLNEIVFKTSSDSDERLEDLEKKKRDIEIEISRIKAGDIDTLSSTQVKERYYDLMDSSRRLLSDFKTIEYNFRDLDKKAREDHLNKNLKKGRLLEEVFANEDYIWDTDQGKSFKAFWEFIMSASKQRELESLIKAIGEIPEIQSIEKKNYFKKFKRNLVESGSRVNETTHLLIEHLGRFINDRVIGENRRIIDTIKEIKKSALARKEDLSNCKNFMTINANAKLNSVMTRPLYSPPKESKIKNITIEEGETTSSMDILYNQTYIDKSLLEKNIKSFLQKSTQASLKDIIETKPLTKGVAELIGYLELATADDKAYINDSKEEIISIENRDTEKKFQIKMPEVIFVR